MPWLGDAVTVTVAPGGRDAARSKAFDSGISSNFARRDEGAQRRGHLGRDRLRDPRRLHPHAPHTFESGKDAFLRSIHSRSSSSTASSIGGGSYSASIFFQIAFAR